MSSVTFGLHAVKNSILSLMLLLMRLVKCFKIRSKKFLNPLAGHFGPNTDCLRFKVFGF